MTLTLKDTVPMMTSDDYKERFKAEYFQLKIRRDKLSKMIDCYYAEELDFKLSSPIGVYMDQMDHMDAYLHILEKRARHEGIDLNKEVINL